MCDAAHDDEVENRVGAVRSTDRRVGTEPCTGWPALEGLVGPEVVRLAVQWLGVPVARPPATVEAPAGAALAPAPAGGLAPAAGGSPYDPALGLVADLDLWRSAGKAYCSVRAGGHTEHHPVRSAQVSAVLMGRYFARTRRPLKPAVVDEVKAGLEARALYEGAEHPVHVRAARHGGHIYLGTGWPDWSAVEVGPNGWRVVPGAPVRFVRGGTHGPLYRPEPGGRPEDFLDVFNVRPADLPLLLAGLVDAWKGAGGYWCQAVRGEQGTGKSGYTRRLVRLLDPQTAADLSPLPRSPEDLILSGTKRLVVGIDNVSHIDGEMSDALCRLATGGGLRKRRLYSDDDETVLSCVRPAVLNGIGEYVTRGDLLDRTLAVRLAPIAARRTDGELDAALDRLGGRLVGVVLDHLARGLGTPPARTCEHRMAESVLWARRCGVAGFDAAYLRGVGETERAALDGDVTYDRLSAWLAAPDRTLPVEVTKGELFAALFGSGVRGGPASPRGLGDALRRLAPAVRRADGLDIRDGRITSGPRRGQITVRIGWAADVADVGDPDVRPDTDGIMGRADVADVADFSLLELKGRADEPWSASTAGSAAPPTRTPSATSAGRWSPDARPADVAGPNPAVTSTNGHRPDCTPDPEPVRLSPWAADEQAAARADTDLPTLLA